MKKQARRQLMLLGINHRIFLMLIVIFVTGLLFTSCKRELITTEGDTAARTVEGINKAIITETAFFEKNKGLGGEATISKSEDKVEGSLAFKVFYINVPADGEYYLSAWVNSPALDEQKSRFSELGITVNNEKQKLPFGVKEAGWHSGAYNDVSGNRISFKLKKGLNSIGFSIAQPLTPSVDFIRLSRDKASSDISDQAYKIFLNDIKKSQSYKAAPGTITDTLNTNANKSASFATMSTLPADPDLNDYAYALDKSFNYSYYMTVYLTSGKNMSFTSWAGSQLHVLEVFSANNPESQSWTAASTLVSGSQRGYVAFTVPTTGTYYVKLRSYYGMETGTASLVVYAGSGSTPSYYYNCPVTGWLSFGHSHYNGQEMNYFTAYTASGDPRLWVVDNNGFPGKVCGYNDDYYGGGGDFYWGLNSRVKKNFGRSMQGVIVSAYSSYNPTGVTDLYSGCKHSNLYTALYYDPITHSNQLAFPNLKVDDAIMSSPATPISNPNSIPYNCFAWAGGFTSFWMEGITPEHNYGSGYVWSTWDDYYGNNPERYIGAMTYTTDGTDASNAVVAMWALSSGEITHGSVRKPGNYHAHGYDWESKPGDGPRTFHPRDALAGPVYGSIVRYYRIDAGSSLVAQQDLMFEESVARGLTTIENVELNSSEKSKISSCQISLKNGTQTINNLHNNWISRIRSGEYKLISNVSKFIETKEGQQLLAYSKAHLEEAVLFFASVIFNNDKSKSFERNVSYYKFWEIARDKYGRLMENVKADWKNNKYTKDRKYIAPLPETFTKKYIKAILAQL